MLSADRISLGMIRNAPLTPLSSWWIFTLKRPTPSMEYEKSISLCLSNSWSWPSFMISSKSRSLFSGVRTSKPSSFTIFPKSLIIGGDLEQRCTSEAPFALAVVRNSSMTAIGYSPSDVFSLN